jgi:hypothetical protein
MLDLLLPRLKHEIHARLAELRPLVDEAEQLEVARAALLADIARRDAAAAEPVVKQPVRSGRKKAAPVAEPEPETNGHGARSATQQAIIAVVDERPGVSLAEIVSVTKLAKPTVAAAVTRLKREGVLADEAGGVKLAARAPVTLAQIAAAAAGKQGAEDAEWEAARPKKREGAAA